MAETTDKPTTGRPEGSSVPSRYPSRPAGARPGGPAGAGGPGMKRGRPMMKRRVCRLCADRNGTIDWKAVNTLRSFVTERGKILSARSTGTCSSCQRQLTRAIKRARNLALLPTSPI